MAPLNFLISDSKARAELRICHLSPTPTLTLVYCMSPELMQERHKNSMFGDQGASSAHSALC